MNLPTGDKAMSRRFLLSLLMFFLPSLLWAQLPTATLNGVVTDPQSAVVSGAQVILKHPATATTREVVTDNLGRFQFANLAPGVYIVRIEAKGFTPHEFKDINLEV